MFIPDRKRRGYRHGDRWTRSKAERIDASQLELEFAETQAKVRSRRWLTTRMQVDGDPVESAHER